MPKNMISEGKLGAKGGIAGNERGMRMDIIYGECTILYIMYMQKAECVGGRSVGRRER